MLPKWVKRPFDECELLAYDDGERLAFFRLRDTVYTLPYSYLDLCDEGAQSQLMTVVERFGRCIQNGEMAKAKT